MKIRPYFPLFLFILFCLLAACGRAGSNEATIKIEAMRFLQDEITVEAGQLVTLRLNNKDGYAHAFDLDEFDIHLQLAAEETAEITFTPTSSGTFTFYCSSPGHQAAGMAGSLVVVP